MNCFSGYSQQEKILSIIVMCVPVILSFIIIYNEIKDRQTISAYEEQTTFYDNFVNENIRTLIRTSPTFKITDSWFLDDWYQAEFIFENMSGATVVGDVTIIDQDEEFYIWANFDNQLYLCVHSEDINFEGWKSKNPLKFIRAKYKIINVMKEQGNEIIFNSHDKK